jgi:DNA-binding NtrC family response regulator
MRVLLAEDESSIAELYKILLQSKGHEVIHVADGESCLAEYKKNLEGFGVVLLDYRMPKMDGLTVASEIHKLNPKQAMLIITAYLDVMINEIMNKLENSVTCLQKPVDPDLFGKMVETEAEMCRAKLDSVT